MMKRVKERLAADMCMFERNKVWNWSICAIAAIALPLLFQVLVEFQRTASVYYLYTYLEVRAEKLLVGLPVLALFFMGVSIATRRPWVACLVSGLLVFCFGAANRYKLEYRNAALVPRDVLQIKEAIVISGDLGLRITREMWVFLAVIALSCAALFVVRLPRSVGVWAVGARVGGVVLCVLGLAGYMRVLGSEFVHEHWDIEMSIGGYERSAYENTTVTNFFYLLTRTAPPAPQGYTPQAMQAILAQVQACNGAQGRESDVIFVLLESYFQFDEALALRFSQPLTSNYDRLAAQGISGTMLSDCYGGGTAIVEYSGMTGFAQAFYPVSMVPFIETVRAGDVACSQYFAREGYTTFSLHSCGKSLYNRPAAYNMLGIQTSYWDADIENPTYDGSFITDLSAVQQLARCYEAAVKECDAPIYAHCVTMQNHVEAPGQGVERTPIVTLQNSEIALDDAQAAELASMASSLYQVDEAIGWICDYFATVDRDVTLVFFGDHQTDTSSAVMRNQLYASLPPETQTVAMHTTPFLIWSNFEPIGELVGKTVDGYVSVWNLLPLAAHAYDITRPLYFEYLASQFETLQGYGLGYAFDGEGVHAQLRAQEQTIVDTLALIQYDAIYGERYITDALFAAVGA